VSNFNHFDVIGPETADVGEITQNNGHYAVQGHAKSTLSVPIVSPYVAFYLWIILT